MKDVTSARTALRKLPDGRLEATIEHEELAGVTPEMLVWWFRYFPQGKYEFGGKLVTLYRIWHPRDHIRLEMQRNARSGEPGVSRGAKIIIRERIGKKITRTLARVRKMDETGLRLVVRRFFFEVGNLEHEFTRTATGTGYRSRLVVGSQAPIVGRLLTALATRFGFDEQTARAWLKHNVEEVGNFQFFLPQMYAQRPPEELLQRRRWGERT
ncbi:MAG TPA: hypothetical protein VE997_04880 [Candidatus Limnocylindria bacterium]|nr:hypothetical protein [Candidatus Limnocylindria bacterium]